MQAETRRHAWLSILRPPLTKRDAERSALHTRYLNGQMVRVLKTLSYDVGFHRAEGPCLFDRGGARYRDLLAGWGVFAPGRNHP